MKKKSILMLTFVLVLALACTALVACDLFGGGGSGTSEAKKISVDSEVLYMNTGSTHQIVATLSPAGESDAFLYVILNQQDRQYLTVSDDGLLTAKVAKDDPIQVRVYYKADRTIYKDILVHIEDVKVKDLSFESASVILELGDEPYALNTKVVPENATGSIIYDSKDTTVCMVDADGNITPVSVGKTTVTAKVTNTESGEPIVVSASVTVKYAPLSYTAYIESEYMLHQLVGNYEQIKIELEADNEYCDPSPSIEWFFNDLKIAPYTGSKTFTYTPSALTAGQSYKIYAKVTDDNGDVKKIEYHGDANNPALRIALKVYAYNPLTSMSLSIPSGKFNSCTEGDLIDITVNITNNQYVPEQFKWYVKKDGASEKFIGDSVSTVFSYLIGEHGDNVTLSCIPVIKGEELPGLKQSVNLGNVAEITADGTEIYNVYVEGGEFSEGNIMPVVYWDAISRPDAEYRVQFKVGQEITTIKSTDSSYASYFRPYGFFIPANIADFATDFQVKVGTDGYQFTDWVTYTADTITAADEEYLEFIVPGMNGYISNMEEFGRLLNYINVFRPADIYYDASNQITGNAGYAFYVKFTFAYSSLDAAKFPTMSDAPDAFSPEEKNVFNLVSSAYGCYCDTSAFSFAEYINNGKIGISFAFNEELFTPEEVTDTKNLNEIYGSQSYPTAAKKRTTDVLPVDSLDYTLTGITTSNQLYYALNLGYRPVPVVASAADSVYTVMRAVLKRICSDTMTEEEKVHAIYDFLSTEVAYDYSTVEMVGDKSHSEAFFLEGVFYRHRAVCDGIAKSFIALCRMEGITAIKIGGVETKNLVAHAWNKVLVGGNWYGVDATWGSMNVNQDEYQNHAYLMVTDEVMNEQHIAYGKNIDTAETSSNIFYGAELGAAGDGIVQSISEAEMIGEYYVKDKLVNVNDTVVLEVELDGIDITTFLSNMCAKLKTSYATGTVQIRDNIYVVTITKK